MQSIVRLLIDELLGRFLSLTSSLGSLEAFQPCVVDLYLFQDVALGRLARRCRGLGLSHWLRLVRWRALGRLSGDPRRLGLVLWLVRLLPHDLLHVVDLGLLVLIVEVAAATAVVVYDELVASSVDLCYHLVLLRCLRRRVATTSADCARRLVRGRILHVPRLLIRRRGHLKDVDVLWLRRTASARPARRQRCNRLPTDHTVGIAGHVYVAGSAHRRTRRPLRRRATPPGIFAVPEDK